MMELEDDGRKLIHATESLTKLKSLLGYSSDNCTKMVEILTQFDDRLMKLEETVQPVYKETGILQRQQENINSTLGHLDYVIKFYTVAGEVEPNIINGPGSSSMYTEYIRDLNRLAEAVRYFEHNNHESPELMNCSSLFEKGGQIIEKEFRQNLIRHSEEIKKVDIILDMIRANNNSPQDGEDPAKQTSEPDVYKIFKTTDRRNQINPEKIISDLRLLAEWLCLNRNQEFVALYSKLRSDVLTKSLQNLRSYLKTSTLNTMVNFLGTHLSPLLGGRKNLHLMKTMDLSSPTNVQEYNMKSRGSLIRRLQDSSIFSSGGNTGVNNRSIPQSPSQLMLGADSKDIMDMNISEREIFAYVLIVTGLWKLMQLELSLIEKVIPVDYQKTIFSQLIMDALESVCQEGDQLSIRVKRSVQKQDFSSALHLLPVYRYLLYMRHSFDLLLEGCELKVSTRLKALVMTLLTTISKTLDEFTEYIKSDMHHRVPKDGTVHELTSNVMLFLVHLQSYTDILSRVVTVNDPQLVESSSDNRIAFALYIYRVLSALGLSLRKRSESYHNEPSLQALFLLNNTYYILKTLNNSQLISIILLYSAEVQNDYNEKIKEFKMDYQQCWNKCLQYINEGGNVKASPQKRSTMLPTSHSAHGFLGSGGGKDYRLKDKDRQAIKDKFTGFNKEFELVVNSHSAYAIPDKELREELKREHVELVVPIYRQFYSKYGAIDFTKNVDKYIKYTPARVEQSIVSLFDELA